MRTMNATRIKRLQCESILASQSRHAARPVENETMWKRALAIVLIATAAPAVCADEPALKLHRSLSLSPPNTAERSTLFVAGDRYSGTIDDELAIEGSAELRRQGMALRADRLRYWQDLDEVEATGDVRLWLQSDRITGPRMRLRVRDSVGIVNQPTFNLAPRASKLGSATVVEMRGEAETLRLQGEDQYRLINGSFTSCKPGVDDWYVNAREMDLDFADDVGVARGGQLTFKGLSTPRLPWFEFPLSNARKSGLLPPSFGGQGKVGLDLLLPFYWNIAPNRDATISPRYMSRRGLQLLTEARYVEPSQNGLFRYEYLPNDQVLGINRYAFNWTHSLNMPGFLTGAANVNKISDDAYFRDLSGRLSIATQVFMPREGLLTYATSPWWNLQARIQRFQTLQDPKNPVTPPYERAPQLTANSQRLDLYGFDFTNTGEFVAFDHPTLLTGRRAIAQSAVSYPMLLPGAYLTPKATLHLTQYSLTNPDASMPANQNRAVPLFSLDSGLFFERPVQIRGQEVVQTLEPRLYYVYVPFRRQDTLPVFDSGVAELNYANIFTENYYSGGDRIGDTNQLTVALTSRLIRASNGQETLRALLAQRFYFDPQRVTLSSSIPARTERYSSYLVGLGGQILPRTTMEAAAQLSSERYTPERFNVGARYQAARNQLVNLSYRYLKAELNPNPDPLSAGATNKTIRQIDASVSWPIMRDVSFIGRYNFSLVNRQAIESLVGVEYNAGCWIVRAVSQQFVTATGEQTRLFFVQLELDGFSRIGTNPLEALRRSVPGYSIGTQTPNGARPFDLYD